jgi:hypothetical protein
MDAGTESLRGGCETTNSLTAAFDMDGGTLDTADFNGSSGMAGTGGVGEGAS